MLKRLLSLGAAALAALGSACEDGPATVSGTWRSPATWSTMVYATSKGPMLVQVHGDPFGQDAAGFRALLAEAMTDKVFGRPTAFTADPERAPHPGAKVVLAFNPPESLDPHDLCGGQVATASGRPERITVQAVFCAEGRMLASVRGWVAKVEGPTDKRFLMLMGQVTRELFGSGS